MVKITFDDFDDLDAPASSPKGASSAAGSGAVELSSAAASRISEIMARKSEDEKYLRVRVDGGGCNGYSYKFMFEKEPAADDIRVEKDGITVLIDATSYNYLMGSVIDYVETLEASQFVINNPNATSSCGCGNSFSL